MNLDDLGWRILDGGACAWFDVPPHAVGAALALVDRIAGLTDELGLPDVNLRTTGVRVRVPGSAIRSPYEQAVEIAAAARELGLTPDPAALQAVGLMIDAVDTTAASAFWQTALDYEPVWPDDLTDPLHRDPAVSFMPLDEPRPLRNRIHVDVSRDPRAVDAVKAALGRDSYGPYGLTIADGEGNELDLVPGAELSPQPATADWRTQFSAMTFYSTTSPEQASRLTTVVAGLAQNAGVPLMVDLRADGVTIDSGKDQWQTNQGGADPRFVELAARIQAAARELDLTADPSRLRFVQLGFDAVDVPLVRAFWTTLLGYRHDPRPFVTDIYDPRRINPVLFFQQMDASDVERRQQRNRIRLVLDVPSDQIQSRIDAGLVAGGQIVGEQRLERYTLADPEGNEVDLILRPWQAHEP